MALDNVANYSHTHRATQMQNIRVAMPRLAGIVCFTMPAYNNISQHQHIANKSNQH